MNIRELLDEEYDKAVLETLELESEAKETSLDILMDVLEEEGVTLSEKVFANNIICNYLEILNDVEDHVFNLEEVECDCENCSLN